MDYLTLTNHADIEFLTIINEKTWQSLTPQQQTVLRNAAIKVEADLRQKIQQLESEAIAEAEKHMTVIHLSAEEIKKWREATRPVMESYLEHAGPLGQQIVEAVEAL